MIISRNNKPKFKLQTAYDTLTSRLRGLGYDVDGNIELDTSGYGHGWIKVLRNGRKNNFIYMCSHSDNVDPLCCEPVYRYIKVYNYCDDPKDSNLLGEIPYTVNNALPVETIPTDAEEIPYDNDYVLYSKAGIVWGYMKLPPDTKVISPYTTYPTDLKTISGDDVPSSNIWEWPNFDIKNNNTLVYPDGTTSAFDDVFADDPLEYPENFPDGIGTVLRIGTVSAEQQRYYWPSAIPGQVLSECKFENVDYTICPACLGSHLQSECLGNCRNDWDDFNIDNIFTVSAASSAASGSALIDCSHWDQYRKPFVYYNTGYDYQCYAVPVDTKNNMYKLTYYLMTSGVDPNASSEAAKIKRELITTLNYDTDNVITDNFSLNNISDITVTMTLPGTSGLSACKSYKINEYNTVYGSKITFDKVAYRRNYKDLNGEYIRIPLYERTIGDDHDTFYPSYTKILNYMLHSKVKTFEYSPKYEWNYDEIMNFILYKDDNLPVLPARNGIYHLKTNYYNELKNPSEISDMENVLDGNTCMHLGYLGDNDQHTKFKVMANDAHKSDISYLQAYPYIKDPYKSRYNYFPNNEENNLRYWKTPDYGFFEGIYQYHNDLINGIPNKYVWLTMQYNGNYTDRAETEHRYIGDIDTAEIRKPETDKKWQWQNNFHNFMTQREVKGIYYKESFSARDTLSAFSGLRYDNSYEYDDSYVAQSATSMHISAPTEEQWTQAPSISNNFYSKYLNHYIKGDYSNGDLDKQNNIAWNGVSAYRHVCRTCSGIGMINAYKLGCTNWTWHTRSGYLYKSDDAYHPSNFKGLMEHSACCPTCARTGVQMRYLYYKHKYIKPFSNYGISFNDVVDDRVENGNQILLPDNLIADELKKDLILYNTSAKPVEYWQASLGSTKWSSSDINYSLSFLGANQVYAYTDVETDEDGNAKFIKNWADVPGWNKMTSEQRDQTKKQWTKRLYRVINPPDKFVQYYVFKGHDNQKEKDAWARIFFDKKWIEKQYFENNTLENPNQYHIDEMLINRNEHNHNHISDTYYTYNEDGYPHHEFPIYMRSISDPVYNHNKSNIEELSATCKMCNGEGTIQTFKTDDKGETIYDITGKPVMIDVPCPSCNGNGYTSDRYNDEYNIATCSTCHGEGSITCPTCLGKGTSYKAIGDYTYVETDIEPRQGQATPNRYNQVVGYVQTNGNTRTIKFYTFRSTMIPTGSIWLYDIVTDDIEYGSDVPNALKDMLESTVCPNCGKYIDTELGVGKIPCPECGGQIYIEEAGKPHGEYYRVAPGEADAKKVYKYISINAVSIDNISIEMDNGI